MTGSREPARCAFQPRLNPNTLLCCWNTNEGINLWVCSFIKNISAGKSEPAHPSLCYSMLFLTIGAQKAFLSGGQVTAGRSHVMQPLFFIHLLLYLQLFPHIPLSVCLCVSSFQDSVGYPCLCQSASCVKDLDDCSHIWSASLNLRCWSRTELIFFFFLKTDKAVGIKIESRRSPYPSLALASLLLW